MNDENSGDDNLVLLRGTVSNEPVRRELRSGSIVVDIELTTVVGGHRRSVPVAVHDGEIEIEGRGGDAGERTEGVAAVREIEGQGAVVEPVVGIQRPRARTQAGRRTRLRQLRRRLQSVVNGVSQGVHKRAVESL